MEVITILTGSVALGLLLMSLVAFASPATVTRLFGTPELTIDGRNEVRAVYGGYGLAVAGLIAVAPFWPRFGAGILLTVALSLFGMAVGRGISRAADGGAGFYPWLFLVIEVAAGSALVSALMMLP
jgi:hypothetical protein